MGAYTDIRIHVIKISLIRYPRDAGHESMGSLDSDAVMADGCLYGSSLNLGWNRLINMMMMMSTILRNGRLRPRAVPHAGHRSMRSLDSHAVMAEGYLDGSSLRWGWSSLITIGCDFGKLSLLFKGSGTSQRMPNINPTITSHHLSPSQTLL